MTSITLPATGGNVSTVLRPPRYRLRTVTLPTWNLLVSVPDGTTVAAAVWNSAAKVPAVVLREPVIGGTLQTWTFGLLWDGQEIPAGAAYVGTVEHVADTPGTGAHMTVTQMQHIVLYGQS